MPRRVLTSAIHAALVAVVAGGMVGACSQAPDRPPGGPATAEPRQLPSLPVAEPPLDREALLIAALRAASAAATGADDTAGQRELDAKRFELRLRFGCAGMPAAESELRRWTFDEESRVLRIRVQPGISGDDPVAGSIAGGPFEAIEGFWIRRPWVLSAACSQVAAPQPPAGTSPANGMGATGPGTAGAPGRTGADRTAAAGPKGAAPGGGAGAPVDDAAGGIAPVALRVGLAQFFTEGDARTHRRRDSRAYETVSTIAEGQSPSTQGYDLIVAGRLQRLPNARVIACQAADPGQPPACIISARFERVSLVRPDSGETLAQWTSG